MNKEIEAGSGAPRVVAIARGDGLYLVGDLYGHEGAPLIVLLHGAQSRSAWRGAARRFAESGFQVAAMDLRGHGESDWSPEAEYRFDDYVDDLVRTIHKSAARQSSSAHLWAAILA